MIIDYPIKFKPILVERPWGGDKLHRELGKEAMGFPVGESWEISAIKGRVSVVENGALAGKNLQELIDTYQEKLLGKDVFNKYGTEFPLLIKFIDAKSDLSVQLHPGNELAETRHQAMGKEEMWYVLQAEKESKLYFGFNRKMDKETYLNYLNQGKLPDILYRQPVKKDEVYHIPSGRVHAIGAGVLLAEIQQASDITYRLFDWNRKGAHGNSRELHTEWALDAIDFQEVKNFNTHYTALENTYVSLVESDSFKTKVLSVNTSKAIYTTSRDSFIIYICVAGSGFINSEFHQVPIKKGECVLIPANFAKYAIKPVDSLKLLYVKAK